MLAAWKTPQAAVLHTMKKTSECTGAIGSRWWFESSLWIDERCWSGADQTWHWWKEAVPRMNQEYRKFKWRDGEERTAFAYELTRRASVALLKLPTFPELTCEERSFLQAIFGVSDARWAAKESHPDKQESGYSEPCSRRWNLRETNSALCKLFCGWLESQREKFRITRPKSRPTKSRPVAWTWVEILDAKHGLNDSQRSIKTKASRLAKRFCEQLHSAASSQTGTRFQRFRV
jgi:hypothetical protein